MSSYVTATHLLLLMAYRALFHHVTLLPPSDHFLHTTFRFTPFALESRLAAKMKILSQIWA